MTDARNLDQRRMGQRGLHFCGSRSGENVRQRAAQDQHRCIAKRAIGGPQVDTLLIAGKAQRRRNLFVVIGDDASFGGQPVGALGDAQPVVNVIVRINRGVELGIGARRVHPRRLAAAGSDIVADAIEPCRLEFGSDVVEHGADEPSRQAMHRIGGASAAVGGPS